LKQSFLQTEKAGTTEDVYTTYTGAAMTLWLKTMTATGIVITGLISNGILNYYERK